MTINYAPQIQDLFSAYRNKRRVPEYVRNRAFSTDDGILFPQQRELNVLNENNNPIDSFFEELNSPDMWNNNSYDDGEDKLNDGLWANNAVQPHYEFPSRTRSDKIVKRLKPKFNYYNY